MPALLVVLMLLHQGRVKADAPCKRTLDSGTVFRRVWLLVRRTAWPVSIARTRVDGRPWPGQCLLTASESYFGPEKKQCGAIAAVSRCSVSSCSDEVQMSSEPRDFSASLYDFQFVVRYF